MSTTTTVLGSPAFRETSAREGELHILDVSVTVTGTYDSAARPSFNVFTALQSARQGISAVAVRTAYVLRDSNPSGTRRTATNIALSGTGNRTITFRIEGTSGATRNGNGTGEIADTTVCSETFRFLVVCEITDARA